VLSPKFIRNKAKEFQEFPSPAAKKKNILLGVLGTLDLYISLSLLHIIVLLWFTEKILDCSAFDN
jgi:hypothetical protein